MHATTNVLTSSAKNCCMYSHRQNAQRLKCTKAAQTFDTNDLKEIIILKEQQIEAKDGFKKLHQSVTHGFFLENKIMPLFGKP